MKGQKRAQGTIEYLITYGWALTLVATIIAVLIFVVGEDLSVDTCTNFPNILCKGIGAEGNDLLLVLQNATGQKITINPLTSFAFDGETGSVTVFYRGEEYSLQLVSIDPGGEFTIRAEGKANAREISITFVEEGTGLEKTLTSKMKVTVLEAEPEDTPGIDNCAELQEINDDLAADYYLAGNINCNVAPYNQGQGFEPIGIYSGTFDGQGNTISGLFINRPAQNYVALFSEISATSTVTDLTLANAGITGNQYTASLAGRNQGSISQVSSSGTVTGSGASVGGLVGYNNPGSITQSSFTGNVMGVNNVGGLVGFSTGLITQSNSGGSVQGSSNYVGGLIGFNSGNVSLSHSTASVLATGSGFTSGAGGLTGWNSGSVGRSYSTGNVQSGGNYVGGLTGRNSGAVITSCYSHSSVQTTRLNSSVGGLIGYSTGNVFIIKSYSAGSVTALPAGNTLDGGLSGSGSVSPCTISFWDTQSSGQASTFCGATGKTTAEMKTASTFTSAGWSTSIWNLSDGSYPTLK